MSQHFRIGISSGGTSPGAIRLRDFFDLMHHFQQALTATAGAQEAGETGAELYLVSAMPGSAVYEFSVGPFAYSAAVRCATAIAAKDLSPLREEARESILAIYTRVRSKGWVFRTVGGNGMPEAEISPASEFLADAILTGESSLFGKLIWVGGSRPTAQFLLDDKRRFTASIDNEALAMRLGELLYRNVSVEGEAEWSASDMSLVSFKITAIGDYNDEGDLMATLANLRTISGDRWDSVDPDDYITQLRSEVD